MQKNSGPDRREQDSGSGKNKTDQPTTQDKKKPGEKDPHRKEIDQPLDESERRDPPADEDRDRVDREVEEPVEETPGNEGPLKTGIKK